MRSHDIEDVRAIWNAVIMDGPAKIQGVSTSIACRSKSMKT